MTKRTRYFIIGSVAILGAGLSIGVMAYVNGGLPVLRATSAPDELQYVPADAAVVAYANVRQVMGSQLRQQLREMEGSGAEKGQDEFRQETGIDIERDVDSVIAFMTDGATSVEKGGAVIVMGQFDQVRIANLVREKGGTVGTYKGRTYMTFGTAEKSGEQPGALSFLPGNLVILGNSATVQRSVDLAGGGESVTGNAKMMQMIRQVDQGNAWVVGRFDALRNQARLPDQVMSQIPPISWFTASAQINGGISGTISVEAASAAAAENLRKVAEGLMGLAGLQAGSSGAGAQLQQLLNSFQLRQDDDTLTLSFSFPSDLLTKLANEVKK
jgi:hypothetical protein